MANRASSHFTHDKKPGSKGGSRNGTANGTVTRTSTGPVCLSEKVDSEALMGEFISERIRKVRLNLTPEQRNGAVKFAHWAFHACATNDPALAAFRRGAQEYFGPQLRLDNDNLAAACHALMVDEGFAPEFFISEGEILSAHKMLASATVDDVEVEIPFEEIFGKAMAKAIARYLSEYLKRPAHAWPKMIARRVEDQRPAWEAYANLRGTRAAMVGA